MRGIGLLTNVSDDKLRGIGLMVDPVNDKLRGVSLRIRDNFFIEVRDSATNLLVDDVTITIVGSENDGVYLTNLYNSVQDVNAAIAVQVSAPNYDTVNLIIAHQGEGFIVKNVVLMSLGIEEIKCDPENKFNFIRWHLSIGLLSNGANIGKLNELNEFEALDEPVDSLVNCDTCTDLPNNYAKSKDFYYEPPFIADDNIVNIINFNIDLVGINTEVVICDKNGKIVHSGIIINEVDCSGLISYYLDFDFPLIKPLNGYRFCIINTDTDGVLYVSNPFRVELKKNKRCFPLLEYRSGCDIFNYAYECITDKSNTLRVDFNVVDEQPDISLKQYREQSTGITRNQKSETSKVVTIETYYFDKGANDAMLALSTHDVIVLNGKNYTVKTAHKVTYNRLTRKWVGIIELLDQEYDTVNLHG